MDYSKCAIPKPSTKKHKKKANGYRNKANRYCYYTGKPGAERHEIYGGPNRQTSIDMGFQVDLCQEYHYKFHHPREQEDFEMIDYWKKYYQKKYESKLTDSHVNPEEARKLWMLMIGKNYL